MFACHPPDRPQGRLRFVADLVPGGLRPLLPSRIDSLSTDLPKTSWKREAPFRLGDLEVLPASGELRGRRGVERLRPLLMDILLRLAAEPGAVVRRETLLEDVWPRRMVNDEVLSRAIAELRTALGDDARVARYIETLPKLGYRLVATVEPMAPAAAESQPPAPAKEARRRWPWAAGACALAAVAIGTWWSVRPATPALADLERRLTTARPLTSDPGLELAPRFSPEGDRVAFALAENDEARIVVQTLDGSSRQFIGGKSGYTRLNPVFFPDGKRIAYWKGKEEECAIVEHDLESGLERQLIDCTLSPRSRFDLSSDGRWLVFAGKSRAQFPRALWVAEIDRGAPAALTAPEPGSGEDIMPRFSPDARQVAFFRGSESHRTPWIVTRGEPASARAVAKVDGLSYGLAWLGRDGPLLAAADWYGFRALNVLDIKSGQGRIAGARGARAPDVGPQGAIVWENAVYSANLWLVDAQGGPSKAPLWRSTRYSSQAEFSPDGTRVTFASNRDGTDAIYVASFEGEARRIAFGEGFRYLRPHWSADGRFVYAARHTLGADGSGTQAAVRIPADGGPAEVLAALGHAVNDVREGGDGKLYWGEISGPAMRLLRAPIGNLAQSERLPWPLVSQYQLNRGRIAFMQPQLAKLTLCQLDTLACAPLPIEIAETGLFHWALGERSLYARAGVDNTIRLARLELATGRIAQTWNIAPSGAGASITVSADERKIIVAQEEGPAIDLMLAR
jgi:Tol biopolymer transport system component/DNA-binding winged helix-turn-helix (wHTH) protein